MKNYLHTLPYFLLFLILAYIPPKIFGQCSCSGGDPATPITFYYKMDTTDIPASVVSFPKFNPSIGVLSCVVFNDTTSLVAISGVRNTASSDVDYEFLLNVTNKITGPGVSITQSATRNYGPSSLTSYGSPGDTTSYGPDTLFQNRIHQSSAATVASYLGTSGNVDFDYKITGGGIATDGGLNYRYEIHSKYWGGFRLTYYWCPNLVLATNIRDFAAIKKDNAIFLKWVTENKTPGTSYKIEYSIDGNNFVNIGETDMNNITGSTTQHEFQYAAGNITSGKLYFRIKQIDALGKVTYSPIRTVDMSENAAAGFTVYPNPVSAKVSLQFDRVLNGNYLIEVTNVAGQRTYNKSLRINNSNRIDFEMNNPPPSGMYYLRITDTKTKLGYSEKLIIRH